MNQLGGGNDAGACRVGGTVRRPVRDWTASVHELLRHLEREGFEGAPRVLGVGAVPSAGARWRTGVTWTPGTVVVHNDATPFNAAWHEGRLTGFFDWDFAGPVTAGSDVAWMAHAWVPLYARRVTALEGLTDFAARPARLRRRRRRPRRGHQGTRRLPSLKPPRPRESMRPHGVAERGCATRESSVAGPGAAAWGRG
ncbi:hypothetical protein HD597_007249 [Nonomuraea thailandensis]|uniref:Aminoglycoside phosphotransferase domain-containing protein n=1 Tax=Nonomuraea thailandensis TaxID=1188745 RepID=A0A9X2GMC3_9ACTN|nr:phosphotransferase [Nonomuraea thailandensis]MCP2360229.1 hypothetical protein [Nonomuraea thailandensis]